MYTADEDNAAGDEDLGSEFGFKLAKKFGPCKVALKYSSYSEGDDRFAYTDTSRAWLTFATKC